MHRMELSVLPNAAVTVAGGHLVTVLFCVGGDCQQWKQALPDCLRAKLDVDNSSCFRGIDEKIISAALGTENLNNFPYFSDGRTSFSPLITGLLSQLASYQLMESSVVTDFAKEIE